MRWITEDYHSIVSDLFFFCEPPTEEHAPAAYENQCNLRKKFTLRKNSLIICQEEKLSA